MVRRYTLALLLAAAFTVGGCANYVKKGDKAMQAGNAIEALKYYQKALDKKPELMDDPEFQGKMKLAGSRAAYMEGRNFANAKNWDAAIEQLNKAIQIDPTFEDAKTRLATVKKDASADFHARAIKSADAGKLDEAKQFVKRAVELDTANTDARDASDSINNVDSARLIDANGFYKTALEQTAQKHWEQADGTLTAAIKASPNHIPARVLKYECQGNMNKANALFNEGDQLLSQKQLDQSIAKFTAAMDIWPYHPNATNKLADAKALRSRAEDLYQQAVKLAEDKDWDQAAAIAKLSVDIFPYHSDSPALLARANQHAAAAHYEAGNGLLDKGKFDDAEKEYRRALQYQPDMLAAKEGIAMVDGGRGDKEAQAGNWGSALLWYIEAQEYSTNQKYKDAYARAHDAVVKRISFNLLVKINQPTETPSVTTQELSAKLTPALAKRKSDYITIGAQKAVDYEVSLVSKTIKIDTTITGSEEKLYDYKIDQTVPNPEVARLETLIRDARRDLEYAENHRYERCSHCNGTGRFSRDSDCTWCDGTGRVEVVSDRDLRDKRQYIRDLRDQLQNTPATVVVQEPAQWKYILKSFRKTGELGGLLTVRDAAGKSLGDFDLKSASENTDTTIEGANPNIGLAEKPLSLPDDATVRDQLVEKLADAAAQTMLVQAVKARTDAIKAEADKLTQAGKTAEALEKKVDMLLLAEMFDAAAVQTALKQLQGSRK